MTNDAKGALCVVCRGETGTLSLAVVGHDPRICFPREPRNPDDPYEDLTTVQRYWPALGPNLAGAE